MGESQFKTFEDFWPYYLGEHASRTNRTLHMIGTTAAAVTLGVAAAKRDARLLALVPLLGYAPAWIGHYVIEKNRPATFKHPLWSLRGDARMTGLMLAGKLEDELARLSLEDEDIIELYR